MARGLEAAGWGSRVPGAASARRPGGESTCPISISLGGGGQISHQNRPVLRGEGGEEGGARGHVSTALGQLAVSSAQTCIET